LNLKSEVLKEPVEHIIPAGMFAIVIRCPMVERGVVQRRPIMEDLEVSHTQIIAWGGRRGKYRLIHWWPHFANRGSLVGGCVWDALLIERPDGRLLLFETAMKDAPSAPLFDTLDEAKAWVLAIGKRHWDYMAEHYPSGYDDTRSKS
jgi:hypothetical protein